MTRYTSNNYFLYDKIMYLLIFLGIIGFITYRLADHTMILTVGIAIIVLLLVILFRVLSKLATVILEKDKIIVKHLIIRKHISIDYSAIVEFQHQFWYPIFSRNTVKFKVGETGKFKTLKIRSIVPNDEFNDFAHWLKSKNGKIRFTFIPQDSPVEVAFRGGIE